MPILGDPSQYYGPSQDDWALGDIVVAPVAVVWGPGERPIDPYPPPMPQPDGSRSVVCELWTGSSHLPGAMVECWMTPAVIVVDDCVLDKEFNASIERRMRDGVPEAQAEAEARSDQSLDQLIPVAPILPYSRLRFLTAPSIRGAQALGFFPVIESHDPPIDEGYVDFTRTVPVSRNVLRGPFASMSEPARSMLRWKLAQFYALRNQSIGNEIMAAIGKTITDVHVVMDSKKRLVVDLELDQGASRLQLKQEPRALDPPAARLRST